LEEHSKPQNRAGVNAKARQSLPGTKETFATNYLYFVPALIKNSSLIILCFIVP
jgi:hypothetical protein